MLTAKRPSRVVRRGIAAVLAIIILAVLVTLSVTALSVEATNLQQSQNYRSTLNARLAAESGLQFMAYQVQQTSPAGGTSGQALLDSLAQSLQTNLNGTSNLSGAEVAYDGNEISIPAIVVGEESDQAFTASIRLLDPNTSTLQMTVVGSSQDVSRGISIEIKAAGGKSAVFDFGIATKSPVDMTGNASIRGKNNPAEANILSATTVLNAYSLTGNVDLQGDIFAAREDATTSLTGNVKIGGVSANNPDIAEHIHLGAGEGEFPEVEPTVFEPFATTLVTSSTKTKDKTFKNIRIKAGANPNFSGNIVIQGVMFVETPNRVKFAGNTTFTGVIATQDAGDNHYTTNTIEFSGNLTVRGVEDLPATSEFATLRTMPGSFILAPGFGASFAGNFGTVSGCMAADSFSFVGNAGGTVRGGIINYSDSTFRMTGNSTILIDRASNPPVPPGFKLPVTFSIDPESYVEEVGS